MAEKKARQHLAAWRAGLIAIGFVVCALVFARCFAGSGVPGDFRPMLDKMERAIPSITRVGRESFKGGECTPDGEKYPFIERQYRPEAGVSMVDAQQPIFDFFARRGFGPADSGGPSAGELDWSLFSNDAELSVTNEDKNRTPTALITVKLEFNNC